MLNFGQAPEGVQEEEEEVEGVVEGPQPSKSHPRCGYGLQNDFHSRLPMALQSGGSHFGRLSTKNLS